MARAQLGQLEVAEHLGRLGRLKAAGAAGAVGTSCGATEVVGVVGARWCPIKAAGVTEAAGAAGTAGGPRTRDAYEYLILQLSGGSDPKIIGFETFLRFR